VKGDGLEAFDPNSSLITHYSSLRFYGAQHTSILWLRSIIDGAFYQLRLIFW
jgi:hypothetical protein